MATRAKDWFEQALKDMEMAEQARTSGRHEWACFAALPTRYPNSHPQGAPFEHFGPLQSEEALRRARQIIEFVANRM